MEIKNPTPKGNYVLFQAFSEDDKLIYGILEREEFMLEKTCDRDALYTHVAINDDKKSLERILRELNSLNEEIERHVTNNRSLERTLITK